mmetsp:Transcript_30012/g.36541  ORF Transcript_30012/g.36541 Transcript_30012/m.36541 type:complete len:128 (+) Transcript_30012:395-778(+)
MASTETSIYFMLLPSGHIICTSLKKPVSLSLVASAVTVPQLSQYHHLSYCSLHGGNGTQDKYLHELQGDLIPSLFIKTNIVENIVIALKISPEKRTKYSRKVPDTSLCTPKNPCGKRSSVEKPQRTP